MATDPEPSAHFLIRYVRASLGLFASVTIQGAACLTIGSLLTYVGVLLGINPFYAPIMLLISMAIPLWPIRIYYSPERVYERKIKLWDRWVKNNMLTAKECANWKRDLRQWYRSHQKQFLPSAVSSDGE